MKYRCLLPAGLVMLIAFSCGCQRQLPPDVPTNLVRALEIRQTFSSGETAGSASANQGPTQEPTGWATLRGVFKLDGQAPASQALPVTKDIEVCAPGGRQVLSEELVVGSGGGIKNVVIYLTSEISDDEPWTHPDAKPGKTDEVVFDQKECVFLTHTLAMQASQPLKILNSDPVGHNTNLSPDSNQAFNATIPVGGQAIYQPEREERQPFSVVCSIHPWMQAWIITRENSYFAVTDDDGAFEIPNLPAGVDLEFRVWQEKTKFLQDVVVGGASQRWGKGRLTLNLSSTDESQNQLEVAVPASAFQ